jgi:hypothetical protein
MSRVPLFSRLPRAFHRFDADGVLEDYLGVLDTSLDNARDLAEDLLALRSVDQIPDKFLYWLGDNVGYRWRDTKTKLQNRRGERESIPRYSRKGTHDQLSGIVFDADASTNYEVIDMASRLATYGLQGGLGDFDCYFECADFYHDGAFVLLVRSTCDLDELRYQFPDFQATGTRWYLTIVSPWRADILDIFHPIIQASRASPSGVLPLVDAYITADDTHYTAADTTMTVDFGGPG